jgi:glycosyltransferase involved in cell wall biosynthesis
MNPRLSVIVISFSAPPLLERCLLSLQRQTMKEGVEILVVTRPATDDLDTKWLRDMFSWAKWIEAPRGANVPQMRSVGLAESQGEIVALLEDDCLTPETWCADLLQAHDDPAVAIGGGIEPGGYRRGLDWAAYFCEYGKFIHPMPDGPTAVLPGTNVSYKRAALLQLLAAENHGPNTEAGFHEAFVHQRMIHQGQTLKADARLMIYNVNSRPITEIVPNRFHHGRGFGAMRVEGKTLWQRLPYLGIAVCLPPVQVWRILRVVLARKRHQRQALQALPWIGLLCLSWSAGEFMGYAFGPGNSLRQWR